MKHYILLFALGCATLKTKPSKESTQNIIVLDYDDFGPQAAAHRIIGMQWWQWQQHGDSNPSKEYDIKVVVYFSISLNEIKQRYTVSSKKSLDYRYLTLDNALQYLDEEISADIVPEVTIKLKKTKKRLEKIRSGDRDTE